MYYPAASLSATETLVFDLSNYQVLTSHPQASGPDAQLGRISWSGNGDLSPVMTAVDPSAQDARNKRIFLAGTALATAAAALIALTQEISRREEASARADSARPYEGSLPGRLRSRS